METPRDVTPLALGSKTLHGACGHTGMWTHAHVDRSLGKAWNSRDAPPYLLPCPLSYMQAAAARPHDLNSSPRCRPKIRILCRVIIISVGIKIREASENHPPF